jgi:hypothetical protein
MSDQSGLAGLVAEIRGASRNIELADNRHSKRLDGIEASINELYKKSIRCSGSIMPTRRTSICRWCRPFPNSGSTRPT